MLPIIVNHSWNRVLYLSCVGQLVSHYHAGISSEFHHSLWSYIIIPHLTDEKNEVQKFSVIFLSCTNQISRVCGNLVQIYYFLLLLCNVKWGYQGQYPLKWELSRSQNEVRQEATLRSGHRVRHNEEMGRAKPLRQGVLLSSWNTNKSSVREVERMTEKKKKERQSKTLTVVNPSEHGKNYTLRTVKRHCSLTREAHDLIDVFNKSF